MTFMATRYSFVLMLLGVLSALFFRPMGVARAADVVLQDSGGYTWDIDADGSGHVIDGTDNAYDLWPDLCVPSGSAEDPCAVDEIYHVSSEAGLDLDGRQVVMSSLTIGPVSVRRKIFVPATGDPWARFMEIFYNPAFRPVVIDVRLGTADAAGGRLGSAGDTVATATSDLDTDLEPGDDWWCTDDSVDGGGTPALAHVIQGAGGRVSAATVASDAFGDGPGAVYWEYRNLTIPARSTLILLHFERQAPSRALAEETARAIHEAPVDIVAGMTTEEVLAVANWDLQFVPTADAGGPYQAGEGAPLALDATGSADPNGDIVRYEWDCTNDGTIDISSPAPTGASCTYDDQGDYTLSLTVTDATGFSTRDVASVSITNVAPSIERIDVPATGLEGEGLTFSATVSDPGASDRLTYFWDFGDGTTSTSPEPTKAYGNQGDYAVSLSVSDGDGGETNATASISIANVAPVIDIFNVPALGDEGEPLPFSAFVSDPGRDDTLTYVWDFGDGDTQSGIDLTTPTHVFAEEGVYVVALTVSDGDGGVVGAEDTVTIDNAAPVVTRLDAPSGADEGDTLLFQVQATDPGDDPLSYTWRFGDGTEAAGASVSHAFADDGTYDVTVTVADDDGAWTNAGAQVVITNVAPAIQSLNAPSTGDEGAEMRFSATASDPGEDALTFTWDFGDGQSAEGAQVTHVFREDGTFDLRLTVSDGDGGRTEASGSVEVVNVAPAIVDLNGPSTGTQGQRLEFTATAEDPGDDTLTFAWDFGDGATEIGVDLAAVSHAYTAPGAYTLSLTVADEDGGSNTTSRTVNIDNGAPGITTISAPSSAVEGEEIELTVVAEDQGGDPLVYTWNFGDDSQPLSGESLDSVRHTYVDEGAYTLTVVATDPGGLEADAQHTIHVANLPPTILSTSVPDSALEGEIVTLSATVEDPGAGDVVTVSWDFGDDTPAGTGASVSHAWTQNGTYTVTLLAQDDDGDSALQTFSIPVANVAPAIRGIDGPSTLDEGQEGTWSATVEDPGDDALSYNWSFGDGDTGAGPTVTHAFGRAGTYPFTLTVTDQDGGRDLASTDVTVSNVSPTITTMSVPEEGSEGQVLNFLVDASDPGVDPLSIQWSFGDGKGASTPATSHAYADDGTYGVSVVVTDTGGISVGASAEVVIANLPPEVTALTAPDEAGEGDLVTAVATFFDPGPADTLTASLIWGDGDSSPAASGEQLQHVYADEGTYSIRIKVADDDGALTTSSATVIEISNRPPEIEHFDGTRFGRVGETFEFTATATDPGVEDSLVYRYDWGDESEPAAGTSLTYASHRYETPGNYTVTLTVSDGDGGEATKSLVVNVETGAPYIVSSDVPEQGDEAQPLVFTAQAQDPNGQPQALRYAWDFGDGSDVVEGLDLTTVTHTFPDNGRFDVNLTVTDDEDLSAFVSAAVTVNNLPPVIAPDSPPDQAMEGEAYTFQVVATDPAGEWDPLQYALEEAPSNMTVSDAGLIVWTPDLEQAEAGTAGFTVLVSDGDGGTDSLSATISVAFIDDDADGMPDTWEIAHGLDPAHDDSHEDLDQDGVSNLEEYLAGTAPDMSNAPGKPSAISPAPGAEVTQLPVRLEVSNAEDIDGDALTYSFELYEDGGLADPLAAAREVPEGEERTAWQVPIPLAENHPYWWRCRAFDGTVYGPWSDVAQFLVNLDNEAPGAPVPNSPQAGATVYTTHPRLEVINASDPDGSSLTYTFELFREDLTLVDREEGVLEQDDGTTDWEVNETLTIDTGYLWRARATDPEGLSGPWSDEAAFVVEQGNSPPSPPEILSPEPGDRVDTNLPRLVVKNATDEDGDALDYYFELDRTATFHSDYLQTSGPIPEGSSGQTDWQVPVALEENATYHWRVSAGDGRAVSDWVPADFLVDAINDPPGAPTLQNPSDGSSVPSGPLTLSLIPTTDPDGDVLTYTFLIRDEAGVEVFSRSDVEDAGEGLVTTGLDTEADLPEDRRTFYWTAFARDDRGLSGDEAVSNRFDVQRSTGSTPTPSPGPGDGETSSPEPTAAASPGGCACNTPPLQAPGIPWGAMGACAVVLHAIRRARRLQAPPATRSPRPTRNRGPAMRPEVQRRRLSPPARSARTARA